MFQRQVLAGFTGLTGFTKTVEFFHQPILNSLPTLGSGAASAVQLFVHLFSCRAP